MPIVDPSILQSYKEPVSPLDQLHTGATIGTLLANTKAVNQATEQGATTFRQEQQQRPTTLMREAEKFDSDIKYKQALIDQNFQQTRASELKNDFTEHTMEMDLVNEEIAHVANKIVYGNYYASAMDVASRDDAALQLQYNTLREKVQPLKIVPDEMLPEKASRDNITALQNYFEKLAGGIPQAKKGALTEHQKRTEEFRERKLRQARWEKFFKTTSPYSGAARGALGMAGMSNIKSNRALSILSDPNIVLDQYTLNLVNDDIQSIMKGGAPTDQMLNDKYQSLATVLRTSLTRIGGIITAANVDQIKEQYIEILKGLIEVDNKVITDNFAMAAFAFKDVIESDPEGAEKYFETLAGTLAEAAPRKLGEGPRIPGYREVVPHGRKPAARQPVVPAAPVAPANESGVLQEDLE